MKVSKIQVDSINVILTENIPKKKLYILLNPPPIFNTYCEIEVHYGANTGERVIDRMHPSYVKTEEQLIKIVEKLKSIIKEETKHYNQKEIRIIPIDKSWKNVINGLTGGISHQLDYLLNPPP